MFEGIVNFLKRQFLKLKRKDKENKDNIVLIEDYIDEHKQIDYLK